MPKRKLFSQKDGSTFLEDAADIAEDVKAFFNHLPLELKKLLPIAEDIVMALQNLDDMLEEGEPVNEAIEKVLAMTKTEVDDKVFHFLKESISNLVNFLEENAGFDCIDGGYKLAFGSDVLINSQNINRINAQTAIQLAVYAVKS